MSSPITDKLIESVMAKFHGEGKAAQARYFEAVHQELAPLCREFEYEITRLNEILRFKGKA